MPKIEMKKQDPLKRVHNFNEVALGLTEEEAVTEAKRCISCKKPKCVEGCPVEVDIPGFIAAIRGYKFDEAAKILKDKNNLPAVCGRVCPQEDQCEIKCIIGKKDEPVGIGRLERFAADWEIKHSAQKVKRESSGTKKIAVIGSGPAGLTCAADLAKMEYAVTLFESLHIPGGVLVYGIPEFRLPKDIVGIEVDCIRDMGVELKTNALVGRTFTIDELKEEGYSAFFIGTGAGLPYFLGIDGENLNGVYSANEFLTRVNMMKGYMFPEYDTPARIGKRVGVFGAGNVAMDSARCAKRLGAEEVTIIYRRSEKEMPARIEEIENAREEGIKFELLTNPKRIVGNEEGWVKAVECMRNKLGESDASGRARPVPIEGSEFTIEIDTIVCAIGQGPNPLLLGTMPDLKLTRRGNIEADSEGRTSIEGVFAGGDIVTGAATVISAMGAGKHAARQIDKYLKDKDSR